MALDLSRIKALCFDVDGTISDTDDHLVASLASLLDKLPLVSGRRAERLARQTVMAAETPVHAAYAILDQLGLDTPIAKLQARLRAVKARGADAEGTRNIQGADEVPHDMTAGVQEMLVTLAKTYPMCTITTGREFFSAVVTAQTTRRMKPHPEPLFYAAKAMGVEPGECLMIGDTTMDIRCGKSAGAQTVGVLCGFGTERELLQAGANLILRTTSDLLGVLQPADDPLGKSASPDPGVNAPDPPSST
jgi:N-acetyl-D-muramate 6-phosphate phosphatase